MKKKFKIYKGARVHTPIFGEPTSTDTEPKSFFDYSDKEKEEIVRKAAEESNRMQQELMDTSTESRECSCHCHGDYCPDCKNICYWCYANGVNGEHLDRTDLTKPKAIRERDDCMLPPENLPKEEPYKICSCHKGAESCTGCELGTECESRVHYERKPVKSTSKEEWDLKNCYISVECEYGVGCEHYELDPEKVKAFIANELQDQRKRIIEEIEKLIVTTPSGNCPSCRSGSSISGYHPHDTLHHYAFYNKALEDIIKVIEKEGKE